MTTKKEWEHRIEINTKSTQEPIDLTITLDRCINPLRSSQVLLGSVFISAPNLEVDVTIGTVL